LIVFESRRSSTAPGRLARARGRVPLSRSRDDGEGRAVAAAKRPHWPEFAVDGPAPSVTPRHFHDILIGTDLPKLIYNNAFRLQRKTAFPKRMIWFK
jgi:hypothetical protein